jgi:hypothetical protein
MKFKSIFGLMLLSVLALCSCSDDDDYKKGKQTNEDGNNVYFSAFNEATVKIGVEDRTIELYIERDITDNAAEITVPLIYNEIDKGVFDVPESVTFAENETMTIIEVGVSEDLKMFKEYMLSISIPEEYTYPYAIQVASPIYYAAIVKEDYATVANGTFKDWFFGSWEQTLEYSEILGIYRFPNLIVNGVNYYFYWNVDEETGEQTCYFTDSEGNYTESFTTGYKHSMGEIYAEPLYDYPMGMLAENVFGFPLYYWIPSANAAAGENYSYYYVSEWAE